LQLVVIEILPAALEQLGRFFYRALRRRRRWARRAARLDGHLAARQRCQKKQATRGEPRCAQVHSSIIDAAMSWIAQMLRFQAKKTLNQGREATTRGIAGRSLRGGRFSSMRTCVGLI